MTPKVPQVCVEKNTAVKGDFISLRPNPGIVRHFDAQGIVPRLQKRTEISFAGFSGYSRQD
jgi:hypothetical protein